MKWVTGSGGVLAGALEISAALPMITAGADVYVARGLVVSR